MPRRGVKILKANNGDITLETTIGTNYRFSIPKSIRNLINPKETVQITIKRIEEVKT